MIYFWKKQYFHTVFFLIYQLGYVPVRMFRGILLAISSLALSSILRRSCVNNCQVKLNTSWKVLSAEALK